MDSRFKYNGNLRASTMLDSKRIAILSAKLNEPKDEWGINDAVEFFNYLRYCTDGEEPAEKILLIRGEIAKTMRRIIDGHKRIVLDTIYQEDFVELILEFSFLDPSNLSYLLDNVHIYTLVKYKKIVDEYNGYIEARLREDPKNFEIIIKSIIGNTKLYIPEGDYGEMLNSYMELETIHPDYLLLLSQGIRGLSKYASVYNETTMQKALAKYNKLIEPYFQTGDNLHGIKMIVTTSKNEYLKVENTSGYYPLFVDKDWICANCTAESVLNYIATRRSIFHLDRTLSLVKNDNIKNPTDFFGIKNKNNYNAGLAFSIRFNGAVMYIAMLDRILKDKRTSLLNVAYYYFERYIKNVYGITFPKYKRIKNSYEIEHKTSLVCGYIEHILKCWVSYCRDGNVNGTVLNIMSSPLKCGLPSMVNNKYCSVTAQGARIEKMLMSKGGVMAYAMDDDGAMATYQNIVSFFSTNNSPVKMDENFLSSDIMLEMIDGGLFSRKDNSILPKNWNDIRIYYTLWHEQSLNKFYYDTKERDSIDSLISKGYLEEYSSLLTREESDLLEYVMTNNRYDDGIGLRNKYAHGIPIYDDANFYKKDYAETLLVLMMLIIKIDDDLNQHFSEIKGKTNYMTVSSK